MAMLINGQIIETKRSVVTYGCGHKDILGSKVSSTRRKAIAKQVCHKCHTQNQMRCTKCAAPFIARNTPSCGH